MEVLSKICFHESMLLSMSSGFTVALVIPCMFACMEIVRVFSSPMTSFASFVGIPNTWFIDPVGYSVRCRGDRLGYGVVDMDDGLPCNSTSLKCTK